MIIHIEKIWSLVKEIDSTCILSFFFLLVGNQIVLFFSQFIQQSLDLLWSTPKPPVLLVLDGCSGLLRVL